MPKVERPCYIVGNWKMYKTIDEALEFVDEIASLAEKSNYKVWLAVPFTAIHTLAEKAKNTKVVIGAQNMNDASEGAFTGEIAANMLKDAGAQFVILGHSERRQLFNESNAFINRKIKKAYETGLESILCIGETYEEHEEKQEEVLAQQLSECLMNVSKEASSSLIIAYEPVWAVGTGLPATPEVIAKANSRIRKVLGGLFSDKEAKKIPIIYGGSVSASNAENYLRAADIDGLLIGQASLHPESFAKIIAIGQNVVSVS